MRSATIDTQYLLAARGLVFSNVTGFSARRSANGERESLVRMADAGDRSYWTAYDYYMNEREERAIRRARVYASVRAFASRLALRLMGPLARTAFTERSTA